MPVFEDYWDLRMQSATARLAAAQEVIKHNPTRGSAAENAIRTLLREFLPQRCGIGTGFMLTANGTASRQLDVVVFDQLQFAPLYRDGDLVIVSPDSVHVVVEVKSNLDSSALGEAFTNIDSVKALNPNVRGVVFGFESATSDTFRDHLPAKKAAHGTRGPDQILCLGRKLFISLDSTRTQYDCYELDRGPVQQLINEVLSAANVTNLRSYLPTLKAGTHKFSV
jgi:hypothetical protein